MVASKALKVLVIDDEASIRSSLGGYLDDFDFNVVTAANGEDGLELIRQNDYSVAIVDLRLPKMSGESMIMLAHQVKPNLRFLIHTGSVDYELSDELQQIGVRPDHVLHKPQPDLHIFVSRIENLVNTAEQIPVF